MESTSRNLDAHQKPPELLRRLFKTCQKASVLDLEASDHVVDFAHRRGTFHQSFARSDTFAAGAVHRALRDYGRDCAQAEPGEHDALSADTSAVEAYSSIDIPGLVILPALVPLETQRLLLSRTLHRDLSNERHKTNVNFHHDIVYPPASGSFFDYEQLHGCPFEPKDPAAHKVMTVAQFLNKKLRWMTLGGQYDWTEKRYPDHQPPTFPTDLSALLAGLFPNTRAEAAIVNLYSPGDVLSLHRDVSEFCNRGLISISIGCDAIFLIGRETALPDGAPSHLSIRLRSGDAVYMTGQSRYAWHGVPRVVANTCPLDLQSWPAGSTAKGYQSERYEKWRNWMATKRINLNVRQMFA